MSNLSFVGRLNSFCFGVLCILFMSPPAGAQEYSAARVWNEMVLNSIRGDFARPTVHARNLYHTSMAMYDAYAAYDDTNETAFLGKTIAGFTCPFEGVPTPNNLTEAREMAISYAVYRLIYHRFAKSPESRSIFFNIDLVMSAFGYDRSYIDTDYTNGNPAALGNYIAAQIIEFGLQDGSNEQDDYANLFYETINPKLNPSQTWFDPLLNFGNERIIDPNRWQQLDIPNFLDQAGNLVEGGVPPFLGPEWGNVVPFSLSDLDKTTEERDGDIYTIYHDQGHPSYIDTLTGEGTTEDYIWGFSLAAHWKSHTVLDTNYLMDISPNSIGNHIELPETIEGIKAYYDFFDGGDISPGHAANPHTGEPYASQFVPRADYAKVVAEFWADGPESETPPGHWYTILNYVNDQESLLRKYRGEGPTLSKLEWDVKAYLTLGGAMHDVAIASWSHKGYYDYIRPVSAIRYLTDKGQSSDPSLPNYNKLGILLVPGSIEQVLDNDPLLTFDQSNYGQIKTLTNVFEGDEYYFFGDYWVPYQSPNFVTPPFAGYVSGHSSFSRAAAEVLTLFTGDAFFPGGLGSFDFEKENYLEFGPNGPSRDMSLQWATYHDAANQSAISRIWGGIHPPIDDIPGRRIGLLVGQAAFEYADALFGEPFSSTQDLDPQSEIQLYPNPVHSARGRLTLKSALLYNVDKVEILDGNGQLVTSIPVTRKSEQIPIDLVELSLNSGVYNVVLKTGSKVISKKFVLID